MEYYSAFEKKEILLPATTRMDLEHVMLHETSQSLKIQILHNCPYKWNLSQTFRR